MNENIYSVICGTGCYLPDNIIPNKHFSKNSFYDSAKKPIETPNDELILKFQKITGIAERRYADEEFVTSDIAYFAAEMALESSALDRETLDGIIVAHNFGDVKSNNRKSDLVPSLASRVKYKLGIKNPDAIAFDLIFGCPGWLQGIIQADYRIKSGDARRIMVVGADMLSRISDPHDRDSMIYSDGAGAVILEAVKSSEPVGILSHACRTDTENAVHFLEMKESNDPHTTAKDIFLKMNGRKLYEYALNNVPSLVKQCIEKAGLSLENIKKVLIHQANEKMDEAILHRLFGLYGVSKIPDGIMPMTIRELGNSSVATLPTLLDMILKGKLPGQELLPNDNVVFASVGAGMNINAFTYRVPVPGLGA